MTCLMSPSKRALLSRHGRAHDDAKNSRFFRGSAQRRKHDTHPAEACAGTGRVRRGLGKGGGSLVGASDSVVGRRLY